MKKLMLSWRGRLPRELVETEKDENLYTMTETMDLENAVAKTYTQSFFNHFGRAAVIPRRLPPHPLLS